MHHSDVLVKQGDEVRPGDPIAGGSGRGEQFKSPRAGGPHVHWEVRHNGVLVNPLSGEAIAEPKAATGASKEH